MRFEFSSKILAQEILIFFIQMQYNLDLMVVLAF